MSPSLRTSLLFALLLTGLPAQQMEEHAAARGWRDTALYGRIITVLHEGVPAAEVWVTDASGATVARTFSDGSGYYQLRRLPRGELHVHAKADAMVPGTMAVVSQGSVREATLPLEDGAPLQGTVVLPDGTPVANASLHFHGPAHFQPPFDWHADAATDARGAWSLPQAPLRELQVTVYVQGLALHEQTIERGDTPIAIQVPNTPLQTRTVQVTGLPDQLEAHLQIVRGGRTASPQLPPTLRRVPLDEDRVLELDVLPLEHEIRVVAHGFRGMPVYVPCQPGDTRDLSFEMTALPADLLQPSTIVRGRVVDELGQPLQGLVVAAMCVDRRSEPVVTDADGRFTLDAPAREKVLCDFCMLSPTRYIASPRRKIGPEGISRLNAPADPNQEIRLDVSRAGSIEGVLKRSGGQPFAAARVELQGNDLLVLTATDAAGRLAIPGIPPGAYTMRVIGGSGESASATVEVLVGSTVEPGALEFAEYGELTGRVVTPDGAPAVSSPVTVASVAPNRRGRVRFVGGRGLNTVMTDRAGRFRVPFAVAGPWAARAYTGQNVLMLQRAGNELVEVEPGKVTDVELTLER